MSPLVAAIGKQPVYAVPEGYFENLPVQVMLRIAIEEKAGADPVLSINKDTPYNAPEGYFDNLAGQILNRIKAQESGNAKDELALLSPLLGQIGKANPFTAPEGYFTDISENIVSGVKAIEFVNGELENLSPLMLGLRNKTVYEVPKDYFEKMPGLILKKAKEQQPARIISFGRKYMRYAAAAVVTSIIALSAFLYFGKTTHDDLASNQSKSTVLDSAGLAKIPDQEIESFLDNNSTSLAYIGTDADTTDALSSDASNSNDTKDLLANISDEELQKYVDQHSNTPITN